MNKAYVIFFLSLLSFLGLNAQNLSDKTLMTIKGEKISVSEFEKVYEKNLDLVQDAEQKKLDNYLPLFISYKAKLIQAREMGLDTMSQFTEELLGYRKELAAPYFKDPKEEEKLLKEAWERSKNELNVSHILLLIPEDAASSDTLKTYKKILSIRKDILSDKISFDDAAAKFSEDPSAKKNKGNLNWMSVFYMLYPFESGAYNTAVGEVSMPIRTAYGYHLIKVNAKRPSKGKVQVAHIVLRRPPSANVDSTNTALKHLADTIYTQLINGKEFAMMARRYSDDKRTGMNGGVLPVLGVGKMMPDMEKLAFSLGEGEISKPFESNYGWHIVKVLKKFPITSFEDSKSALKRELTKDNRSKYIEKSVVDHLRIKYNIVINKNGFKKIEKSIDSSYFSKDWKFKGALIADEVMTIKGHKVTTLSYIKFLENNHVSPRNKYSLSYILQSKREEFIDSELLNYYDNNLENEYPEFKDIMTNYREGILIYNLMSAKIWNKSFSDSLGLKKYYSEHKSDYMWPERADLELVKCFNEDAAKIALKYVKRKKTKEYIEEKLNKGANVQVTFQSGIISKDNKVLPDGFDWKKGISKIYKKGDRDYVIVNIRKFVEPQIKTLEESESSVRSDYQVYLENEWKKELNSKYKADVDQSVLKELKKKYKQ